MPHAIDPDQLCQENYWRFALLPVIGQAFAPFEGQSPDPVALCQAAYRAIFWYCWNNEWPCCGEQDRVDACWARAEEMMGDMFDPDVNQAAKPRVVDEILAQNLERGTCVVPQRPRARHSGGRPRRSRSRVHERGRRPRRARVG